MLRKVTRQLEAGNAHRCLRLFLELILELILELFLDCGVCMNPLHDSPHLLVSAV